MSDSNGAVQFNGMEIAIIGMSGRFPGARNIQEFWCNLKDGVESISFHSDQEMLAEGVDAEQLNKPNYVKAAAVLKDVEYFDASFFGYSHREAELIDPQQRIFLECAHEALEHAGYNTAAQENRVSVFAGSSLSTYLINLISNQELLNAYGPVQLLIANDKDFLATRVSYKLNLEGPSVTVQTACSTSLVAVHLACRSLLSGDCDMALAGGVAVNSYMRFGYLYQEGGILSPDGHCRAFDAKAKGTIFGSGVGIVVLKRLEDALTDGDFIHAIIKGSSINNDGGGKVGYTAPSVDGQVKVIRAAQFIAEVEPETISYIEAHGTGTELGDPIEFDALSQVFGEKTKQGNFCALGSLKTNIGHLDAAAGISSLIKTTLALNHKMIPPSLNFESPNPKIDFVNSPFFVNTKLSEWPTNGKPRRAGVSSFGIGGTNVHVILEEAPKLQRLPKSRSHQLLVLSAKTRSALETATLNLASHFTEFTDLNFADAAYTLQVGREVFRNRKAIICSDAEDAVSILESKDSHKVFIGESELRERPVVFMFPGQGTQYVNMGLELYRSEQTFREHLDRCAELLIPHLQVDLREVLYPDNIAQTEERLKQTYLTQPALFAIEYALAKLWMEWGIYPSAMVGHSVGEYVAACLSGVISLEDALCLVSVRGNLVQRLPEGAMLAVSLPEVRLRQMLNKNLSLAAINAPSLCVLSGPTEEINAVHERFNGEGVLCKLLQTSHAFHSSMMQPVFMPFLEQVKKVRLHSPSIPYVSNVTGGWINADDAMDAEYWARHLRETVRFDECITTLLKDSSCVLLEVGPGRTLNTLIRQRSEKNINQMVLRSLPGASEQSSDVELMLASLGQLWVSGSNVDWANFHSHELRQRVPLPTYPFERERYWISTDKEVHNTPHHQIEYQSEMNPSVVHQRPELLNSYVAPDNEIEKRITRIWQDLLGTDRVGVIDNFFDLGGHSLLATCVVSKLCDEFQVALPLEKFFEKATVRGVAQAITETQAGNQSDYTILYCKERGALQLSFAQQRLWFLDQLSPGDPLHNMPISMRLEGELNVEVLTRALNELIHRHESLRTTFAVIDNSPVQIIASSLNLEFPLIDLRELPDAEQKTEIDRLISEEQHGSFDLAHGPLIRIRIIRLADDDHLLLLTLHHIVADGWSFAILTRELSALYQAFIDGRPSPLNKLPIQYADYSMWQRQHVSGELLDEQLSYWKRCLAGAPPLLLLPTDRLRPSVQSHHGANLPFKLPSHLSDGLQELSRREGVTLFMTLLAAFKVLLYRDSGQSDIIVGADIANRNRHELEGIIGFFVNMLVLRTELVGNQSFIQLLERVREITIGAYAHQDIPFDKLVEELQPVRNASYSPLFQVVFNFYQDPAEGLELPGLKVSELNSYQNVSKFDISLFVVQRKDGVSGFWNYNTSLFDALRIERLRKMYETLIGSILAQPELQIDALEILDDTDKQEQARARRLLKETNFKKFKSLKPQIINTTTRSVVKTELLSLNLAFPLVVHPVVDGIDIEMWVKDNSEFIENNLLKYGALLFRGFSVNSISEFSRFTKAISGNLLDYDEPSSPRSEVGHQIYTSTDYPATQWIQLHNEMSYTRHWPHKVFFCCIQPADEGGETPLASSLEVFKLLNPKIRDRFIEKKVMYVRNFTPGLGLSWQHVFNAKSKAEVNEYCRLANISYEWKEHERLRTTHVHQSVIKHPTTGDMIWFNQAHAFHSSSLEPSVRKALSIEMNEEDFPRNAFYGDGAQIEDSIIDEIRDTYRQAAVTFPLEKGDVLMLENMLVAHGRAPFVGERKILVAMSGMINGSEIEGD